jgi:rod shape-determining protein MreC
VRGSRRLRLTFVLLLLTAFTLTALDYNSAKTGPLAALRRGIDTVFGPVERVVGGAASSVGNALGGLPRLGSYQSENDKLRRKVEQLSGQLAARDGLQCQLDQWYQLMHLVTYTKYSIVPARVVAVGTGAGFEWTATIDAGSKDGLKVGMGVVTGAGLAGRLKTVGSGTSLVLLLADPNFEVGGTLIDQSAPGFAKGQGMKPMLYSLASTRSIVRKGAVLLTTGSGTYAPGIPIGTVTSVTPDTNAISRTATIAPFVDVSAIDLVGVVTNPAERAPRVPLLPVAPGASPTSSPCPAAVPHGPVPTATPTPSPTPTVARAGGSPGVSPSPTRSP